jgi:hypothetical protein
VKHATPHIPIIWLAFVKCGEYFIEITGDLFIKKAIRIYY